MNTRVIVFFRNSCIKYYYIDCQFYNLSLFVCLFVSVFVLGYSGGDSDYRQLTKQNFWPWPDKKRTQGCEHEVEIPTFVLITSVRDTTDVIKTR